MAFAVLMPFIFRLGMEKARLLLALIFVIAFGVIYGGVILVRNMGIEITDQLVAGVIAAGLVLAVAGFFLSYLISVNIVQKKEW